MNTDLFDAVIPSFALHWDVGDLRKAMGNRPILWTDPTNWMGRTVAAGPAYHYRYVIGDTTDLKRSEEHTSELQSRRDLVCRLLLEKKKIKTKYRIRQKK